MHHNSAHAAKLLEVLTLEERVAYKTALSTRISSFFDNTTCTFRDPHDDAICIDFDRLSHLLLVLTASNKPIPQSGVAYFGKVHWLTELLVSSLSKELDQSAEKMLDRGDHMLGCGGILADRLATCEEIKCFVGEHVGAVMPTGVASYLRYANPNSGIRPHIDTEIFSVNLMIKLRHLTKSIGRSVTVIWPTAREPAIYDIEVGEVMILYGSAVVHARTPIKPDEFVDLLTIGFTYVTGS